MKNLCKVIAMTLVVFMVSTNSIAAFAEVKTENNKIQDFIEPEYLNMDSMKLDALIEQNLENDVALNNLLRAKAYKEDKLVDEEYYNLLSEKANNSREDFDKFIAYIEDNTIYKETIDLTEEDLQLLQSNYSISSVSTSDFVIEKSIEYGSRVLDDSEYGVASDILDMSISVGTNFVHPIWGILYSALGWFDDGSVYYSRTTEVQNLLDTAYVTYAVRCKLDNVMYAILKEENSYGASRTIQWNGTVKSSDVLIDLGLVRYGYNSSYYTTYQKQVLGLDMYNIQGFKVVPLNKYTHYDRTDVFDY